MSEFEPQPRPLIDDRPDRYLHAGWMAVQGLNEIFGDSLVQVHPADTGEDCPETFDDATQSTLDNLRRAVSEAADDDYDMRDVLFGNTDRLGVTLEDVLIRATAYGYIWGRLDQISDAHGTNEQRLVRARDLKRVIADACAADPEGTILFSDVETMITDERGSLKEHKK